MEIKIDACGLACPGPVLKAKDAIENKGADLIHVLVDNEAARENVSRFFLSQGFTARIENIENGFCVIGEKSEEIRCEPCEISGHAKKIMVMVASNKMGHGDDELGEKLMLSFLATLREMGSDLWRLVFVNSGVKLCIKGSAVLDNLQSLEKDGVSILVCGTCLTHFDILKKKRVGETTNMLDIVTSMQLADKVINI